ncbi:MAG: TRAP transporter small permease [Rhodobacteraceae bacterium]|nr:TRAP transporter small permease [Paracoccaceae bacterium]
MKSLVLAMRPGLDRLYLASGIGASLCLIMILALIAAQMVARWSGMVMIGAPDYTGYAMAGASFLAMPYALNKGAHIRVNLLLGVLGRYRHIAEVWCFGLGSYLSVYFAYYAIKSTHESWRFNDISQGQDATPLWIPQVAMCVGLVIFAIAFIDHLVSLLVLGKHNITEDALGAAVE